MQLCLSWIRRTQWNEVWYTDILPISIRLRCSLSLGQARQHCQQIITIPYDFEAYKAASTEFYTILLNKSDKLEAVSVDEAYLEVTNRLSAFATEYQIDTAKEDVAVLYAEKIRDSVRSATGCESQLKLQSRHRI